MGYGADLDKTGLGMKMISTPTQPFINNTSIMGEGTLNGSMLTKNGTPIRPLTAAYRAASSEQQVSIVCWIHKPKISLFDLGTGHSFSLWEFGGK